MNCSLASKTIQDELRELRLQTPSAIAQRLRRGQSEGDIPPDAPVEAMAAFYTTVLHGLSIQARDGASRSALLSVVEGAMAVWDGYIRCSQSVGSEETIDLRAT